MTPPHRDRAESVTDPTLDRLTTSEGSALLAAAGAALTSGDALAAATALRVTGVDPELASAALTQAELRGRARAKFGVDADRMFFTRSGLEQATRSVVARRRAARLAAAGVSQLADLGCGIGSDALAAARAGIRVYAVDADPRTAAVARANASALGLSGSLTVHYGVAEDTDLSMVDGVFVDPARRRGGTRIFDPGAFSPPWGFVRGLVEQVPRTVLKLAPGIDHALIPTGAEAQWVSVGGEVVEACFWCGPLAEVPRRATVLPGTPPATESGVSTVGHAAELTGSGVEVAPIGPVRRYLYDPDGAVVRAHLVAEFAAMMDGTLADPTIAYVYADQPVSTPFGRCLDIVTTLPFSLKRVRATLRDLGVGSLTIRKRGSALDPESLRRELRLSGAMAATLVLTRVAGKPVAHICAVSPARRAG